MTDYISQIGIYCSKKCCDDDKRTDATERLRKYVVVDGPRSCWLWVGAVGTDGYGKFWFNGKTTHAHRAAYELSSGPIPEDDPRLVCHTCDTPLCCNPLHLFIGTHRENTADMIAKGRKHLRPLTRITKTCSICGETFARAPYRAAKTSTCSHKCALQLAWQHRRAN